MEQWGISMTCLYYLQQYPLKFQDEEEDEADSGKEQTDTTVNDKVKADPKHYSELDPKTMKVETI